MLMHHYSQGSEGARGQKGDTGATGEQVSKAVTLELYCIENIREMLAIKEDWVLKDSREKWEWKESLDQQDSVAVQDLR